MVGRLLRRLRLKSCDTCRLNLISSFRCPRPRGSALPWGMHSLPKPGYDPETMRAVALAYRRERRAGRLDEPAREAAAGRSMDSSATWPKRITHPMLCRL